MYQVQIWFSNGTVCNGFVVGTVSTVLLVLGTVPYGMIRYGYTVVTPCTTVPTLYLLARAATRAYV